MNGSQKNIIDEDIEKIGILALGIIKKYQEILIDEEKKFIDSESEINTEKNNAYSFGKELCDLFKTINHTKYVDQINSLQQKNTQIMCTRGMGKEIIKSLDTENNISNVDNNKDHALDKNTFIKNNALLCILYFNLRKYNNAKIHAKIEFEEMKTKGNIADIIGAQISYARTLIFNGEYEAAEKELLQMYNILKRTRKYTYLLKDVITEMAYLNSQLGENKKGLEFIKQVREENTDIQIRLVKAIILARLGKHEEAKIIFEKEQKNTLEQHGITKDKIQYTFEGIYLDILKEELLKYETTTKKEEESTILQRKITKAIEKAENGEKKEARKDYDEILVEFWQYARKHKIQLKECPEWSLLIRLRELLGDQSKDQG